LHSSSFRKISDFIHRNKYESVRYRKNMSTLRFLKEYIKHPRTVGALLPSSPRLVKQMIAPINFEQATCIVEYGPGTGVFTEEIIQHKCEDTVFLIVEYNKEFYHELQRKYEGIKNVHVVCDSAEHTYKYLQQYKIKKVDYIVSGLPFTSLPKDVSTKILQVTKDLLGDHGHLILFQYSRFKQNFLKSFFMDIRTERVIRNVPPAFVFTCSK